MYSVQSIQYKNRRHHTIPRDPFIEYFCQNLRFARSTSATEPRIFSTATIRYLQWLKKTCFRFMNNPSWEKSHLNNLKHRKGRTVSFVKGVRHIYVSIITTAMITSEIDINSTIQSIWPSALTTSDKAST